MKRWDIINHFINKYNYTSYLEIGCQKDVAFRRVVIDKKIGVDPERGGTHRMTSDEFFSSNKETFDIIFIDGLHHNEQVKKDIENALKVLNENGTIVVHDCNPTTEAMQKVPRITKEWTGDGWKAWVSLRRTRADLEMKVINTDYGCGIIRVGKQELLEIDCAPCATKYESFSLNKRTWLPLIEVQDFNKFY